MGNTGLDRGILIRGRNFFEIQIQGMARSEAARTSTTLSCFLRQILRGEEPDRAIVRRARVARIIKVSTERTATPRRDTLTLGP